MQSPSSSASSTTTGTLVGAMALDPHYVARVADRMSRLERNEIAVRQDIAHTNEHLEQLSQSVRLELDDLHKELVFLEQQTTQLVDKVTGTVQQFKHVVKQSDLNRMQQRIDLWGPQNKITREQFQRLLERER